jgi:predicted enzyme related to lactoylglutathione lyase
MKMLVNIDVPDLASATAFYCAAFGLHLRRIIDDDVAELTGGSSIIYLLQNDTGTKSASCISESRRYSRHWTPVHIDFVVEDINRAAKQVLDAGAILESECVEWKGSKCVTFSDPFGHGFCLIKFEGETYRTEFA